MATGNRGQKRKGSKRPRLKYFFLDKQLHVKVVINRAKDTIVAWNYPEGKKKVYSYSWVLAKHERAWRTSEVIQMVGRGRMTIEKAMVNGDIERPQHTYSLDENRNMHMYMWHEDDIMALHEFLSTIHQGRPRADGLTVSWNLPTPRELRAMIRGESILYVKEGDEYVPSWRATNL